MKFLKKYLTYLFFSGKDQKTKGLNEMIGSWASKQNVKSIKKGQWRSMIEFKESIPNIIYVIGCSKNSLNWNRKRQLTTSTYRFFSHQKKILTFNASWIGVKQDKFLRMAPFLSHAKVTSLKCLLDFLNHKWCKSQSNKYELYLELAKLYLFSKRANILFCVICWKGWLCYLTWHRSFEWDHKKRGPLFY